MLGIPRNPYAVNVSNHLKAAAIEAEMSYRLIDLQTMRVSIEEDGRVKVLDGGGIIDVQSIAPYLLFGYPTAVHALRVLLRTTQSQNSVDGVLLADDKAATAERLSLASVLQVRTEVCPFDIGQALAVAQDIGFPVVLKRTHGAQGKWVRRASDATSLAMAINELSVEGPGALIVQPELVECMGRSVRVVVTGGLIIAVTERFAKDGDWRSNVSVGAYQQPTKLAPQEKQLVEQAVRAIGLRHAGIDILRTRRGSRILEINACPDFTSMQPYCDTDLAGAVLRASE